MASALPYCTGDVPHDTDTSSLCRQLWLIHPLWGQSAIDISLPTHLTASNKMGPVPGPYRFPITVPLYLKYRQYINAMY